MQLAKVFKEDELPFGWTADDAACREAWDVLSHEIDEILTDFYFEIEGSVLRGYIANTDINSLKEKQKNHWRKIFLGEVDQVSAMRMRRMHIRHLEINLPSTYYLAAYLFLSRRFHDAILKSVTDVDQARQLIGAIDAIVASDIIRAFTMYSDTVLVD
jgi:hypothetical protein